MTWVSTIFIYTFIAIIVDAVHYRGGSITWKPQYPHIPNQNPVPIILKQKHVWRRSSEHCDESTVAKKIFIGNRNPVKCIFNCHDIKETASVAGPCVAYSIQYDWSASEVSTTIDIPANVSFEAAFQGGAWISNLVVGRDGNWSVSTAISTIPRSDGTYNTAPSSSMSSIKLLQVGATYTWEIPVADTDGDIVRCRWAEKSPADECAAVCHGLLKANLTSYPCTMSYTATSISYSVVALKIEDFESSSQTTPLSGTSIQFLVIVTSKTGNCTELPLYYGIKEPNTCTTVDVGTTVHDIVQFSVSCDNTILTEVEMYKPENMNVSVLKVDPLNSTLYTINTTWTPLPTQLGVNLICYTPLDNSSRQGEQTCIKYFVNDVESSGFRPNYISGSMNPVGKIYSKSNFAWSIEYSQKVHQPSIDAYIRFYSNSTKQIVHQINVNTNLNDVKYQGNTLTFFTTIQWNTDEWYYILFDSSIVTDPFVCGPQSPAITDSQTWKFMFLKQDCFSPEVMLIPNALPSSPLPIRRSEDFYISSIILLNCNDSLAIVNRWIIENCDDENCSNSTQVQSDLLMNFSELFIPARTLTYGIYRLTLTVTMKISSSFVSSTDTWIAIIPSDIQMNLIPSDTSMISLGVGQNLLLDPGRYSIDPDEKIFPINDWTYEYAFRMANQGLLQSINHSESSLMIHADRLSPNHSYQFVVQMRNRRNASIVTEKSLLVHVKDTFQSRIGIECVIAKQCYLNNGQRLVNPQSQLKLNSICLDFCPSDAKIIWNVYTSTDHLQWTSFDQIDLYGNQWFFGRYTRTFTAINSFFRMSSTVQYWRFEVIYTSLSGASSSILDFHRNDPPKNGSCSIDPPHGTTSTLFNISCSNWSDIHEIEDYSLYVENLDPTKRLMIAFSRVSTFEVQFPPGTLNLTIIIRDKLDCTIEWNLPSILVQTNSEEISAFFDYLRSPSNELNNHPMSRRLASGNQNIVAQMAIILSGELNLDDLTNVFFENDTESVGDLDGADGILATKFVVAPLGNARLPKKYLFLDETIVEKYTRLLNAHVKTRDYYIRRMIDLPIFRFQSIRLQASALAELTSITNGFALKIAILAFTRCHQFSGILHTLADQMLFEDVRSGVSLIGQCLSNTLTAINGHLQGRMRPLDIDDHLPEVSPINQSTEAFSHLTAALNIHLIIDQLLTINTPSMIISLKKTSIQWISNQSFEQIENSRIVFPVHFTSENLSDDTRITFRSMIQPVTYADQSQLNIDLSRLISIDLFDEHNRAFSMKMNPNTPMEFFIPRDPNIYLPPMQFENVTSKINSFDLKSFNFTSSHSISLHFQIHPLGENLSYLFFYQLDSIDTIKQWTVFCPVNLTIDGLYTFFLDNQQTKDHHSIIYGLRELTSMEKERVCSNPQITSSLKNNKQFHFTANYKIRIYTSGCYYLDKDHQWKSDGLLVGPLTNPYQTHCYAFHLPN